VTLLCLDETSAGRRVAHDAAALSPLLAERCARTTAREGAQLVAALRAARARLELEQDIAPLVREVRELKERIGTDLFDPDVLRAAVEYNAAVWNRSSDLLDEGRTLDALSNADLLGAAPQETRATAPLQAPQMAEDAVRMRARRLAQFRQAQRALGPALAPPLDLASEQLARELRTRLSTLRHGPVSSDDLVPVDELLTQLQDRLMHSLAQLPFAQLRASLPVVGRDHPDELGALVQLCAERGRSTDPSRWLQFIDYGLTLLASEERDGQRRARAGVLQPGPAVESLAGLEPTVDGPGAVAAFQDAVAELQHTEEPTGIIARIQALKKRLGPALFGPQLLPHVITYNLAAWNRYEGLAEGQDALQRPAGEELLFNAAVDVEAPSGPPLRDAFTAAPGAHRPLSQQRLDAALARLEQAVAQLASNISEALASGRATLAEPALELGSLGDWERRAFAPSATAPLDRLVRTVVAAGLSLPGLVERVADEVDPELLQGAWVRGLHQEARAAVRELVQSGQYAQAKALSALRNRYLSEDLIGGMGRERPARRPDPAQLHRVEGARDALRKAAVRAGPLRITRTQLRRQASYVGVLSIVLAAAVGMRVLLSERRPIALLDQAALTALSPHLVAGYRGSWGNGPLFIGTVGPSWEEMDLEAHQREGDRLAEKLRVAGVDEVMLYDGQRKLRFHWIRGALRLPSGSAAAH
jgi:hypothetical protein